MSLSIQQNIFRFQISIDNVLLMKMLNGQTQFCYVKLGLFFRESDLACEMEAEISAWTVIQREIEVMRSLEGEMQIDNEDVIGLFEDIGLDDCVLQLLLKDQVLFLQGFEGVKATVYVQFGQENLAECARTKSVEDRKGGKVYLVGCDLVQLSC